MKKPYLVLIISAIIVIVVIIVGVVLLQQSTTQTSSQAQTQSSLSFTFSDLQANYPQNPAACLATAEQSDVAVDQATKNDIDMTLASTIIDIPAGTNVDVYLKTFDKTVATGTIVYESTYGSYNFTAKKTDSRDAQSASWIVTKFAACTK